MVETKSKATKTQRLEGLDFARSFAFLGMVIVNFSVVMGVGQDQSDPSWSLSSALEGRAAAAFVILAGIGLSLSSQRGNFVSIRTLTLKRSIFLFTLGMINATIFQADILHYYALYFLVGAIALNQSSLRIAMAIFASNAVFLGFVLAFDYDRGWNWSTLEYSTFWTPIGFIRNLFFNGWHPVFPWVSLFLVGMLFGRLSLQYRRVQFLMIGIGATLAVIGHVVSSQLIEGLEGSLNFRREDVEALFGTTPIPPMFLYILTAGGSASALIGLSLWVTPKLPRALTAPFRNAGRQTLTLYIAHILVGMGILDALGLIAEPGAISENAKETAIILALSFFSVSCIFSHIWARKYGRGPVEALMRRVTG